MELNATFFIQMALFFALLAWLTPMLFDPFMKLFEERERRIVGAADAAKALTGNAEQIAQRIEKETAAAQAAARKVLTDLRLKAHEREAEIVYAAREEASSRLEEARSDLFEATEEARRSLREDAKQLSQAIVEKVLGRAA